MIKEQIELSIKGRVVTENGKEIFVETQTVRLDETISYYEESKSAIEKISTAASTVSIATQAASGAALASSGSLPGSFAQIMRLTQYIEVS